MVKQLKSSDDRYNFVGVYLHNPEESLLWLHNYVGESTEHARINVGEGVCGTAVAEKKDQNVADVSTVGNYIACSPRTKSELVILIRAGDDIFGQIDIDAREKNAFPDKVENSVRMVADKLAEVFVAERRT
jgi:GAF domain-containing protein